jgi:hypothetical protein
MTDSAAECPHCEGAELLRRARLVELRDELRHVSSRLSSRLSGLSEPADAIAKLWEAMRLLREVQTALRAHLMGGGDGA